MLLVQHFLHLDPVSQSYMATSSNRLIWLLSVHYPSSFGVVKDSHTQSSYPASLMNGLFSRIFLPYRSKTSGIKLSANAMKPNKLLAQWNPNVRYML